MIRNHLNLNRSAAAVLFSVLFSTYSPVCLADDEAVPDGVVGAEPVAPFSEGHVWLGTSLRTPILSATVTPQGIVLALGADDTIYRRDSSGDWSIALPANRGSLEDASQFDEEDMLMEAEGFFDEMQSLMSGEDASDEEQDASDEDEVAEESTEPVGSEPTSVVSDVTDLWVGDERGDGTDLGPRSGAVVWASDHVSGTVIVERTDGCWRSEDHGRTWVQAGDLSAVHAFGDGHAGHILAGTAKGLRVSVDGARTWDAINDPIVGIEVFSFARDGERIFAGTSEGLYRSDDGLRWAKLLSRHDADVPVWRVAVDRHWEGGLWVTGPVGILRSDDGGEQLRAPSRNSLPGTVSLLALDSPGHVLAAGIDGVWESTDGGTRWRPLANGLPSPANHVLLDGPFVAGADGVFELRRASEQPTPGRVAMPENPSGADVGTLVATALRRPGMDMSNVLTEGSIARAMLLPTLQVTGSTTRMRYISGDFDARSNKGSSHRSWSVGVTACFGACSSASSQSSAPIESIVESGSLYDAVTVVGDEVYSVNESGSLAPMAANVSERVTRYRTDVAGMVGELTMVRHRLIDAFGLVQTLSLREQVKHELDVLESSARLDVYTNGYFSRVIEGS